MILMYIQSEDLNQLNEIAFDLLESKLLLSANLYQNLDRFEMVDGKPEKKKINSLNGKTKAALFNSIDERLREKYPNNLPHIFSVPIVSMDWDQISRLVSNTREI